jgi:diacylglycerol kinase (ATP)
VANASTPNTARVFVVLNPVAGHSDPEFIRQALDRHLASGNRTYQVYETTGQEQLSKVVRAALDEGFNLFVAAGGDGTVSGVAGGLIHSGTPLGIIPVGTGNALARELDIPLHPEDALKLLIGEHTLKCIDAMQVKERFFTLIISVGLTSIAIRDTGRESKRRLGRLAYIWTGLRGLLGFQPQRFTIIVDDQRHRVRASELAVVNAGILGGSPFRWGPHIRLDDGQLDIAIVRVRTLFDYFRLAWDVLWNRQKQDPNIRYLQARQTIEINSDRPLVVQGDGEVIGRTPVQVQVVPNAVQVIIP